MLRCLGSLICFCFGFLFYNQSCSIHPGKGYIWKISLGFRPVKCLEWMLYEILQIIKGIYDEEAPGATISRIPIWQCRIRTPDNSLRCSFFLNTQTPFLSSMAQSGKLVMAIWFGTNTEEAKGYHRCHYAQRQLTLFTPPSLALQICFIIAQLWHLYSERHCQLVTYTSRHALPHSTRLVTRKAIRLQ